MIDLKVLSKIWRNEQKSNQPSKYFLFNVSIDKYENLRKVKDLIQSKISNNDFEKLK